MAEHKEPNGYLNNQQKAYFSKGTLFNGVRQKDGTIKSSRHVVNPFREMMLFKKMHSSSTSQRYWEIKGFRDVRYMELPNEYKGDGRHKTKKGVYTKETFKAVGSKSIVKLKDINDLILHIKVAAHQMPIAFEHWRIVLAKRALHIFQQSFEMKRFNSKGAVHWKSISRWTVHKRKRRGTWPGANKLLQEYNNLYNSLKEVPSINRFTSGVKATSGHAGYHNDPRPGDTYGDGFGGRFSPPKPIVRRQFMGHSTLIDDFISVYENKYMFYTIFRAASSRELIKI